MPGHTKIRFAFENVTFAYPGGRRVLDDACFEIPEKAFALVRGPSGTGKSTLLRLMNRLEEPQSGTIYYRGRPLVDFDPPLLRQKVAYLHQVPVIQDITVRETLLMPFAYLANKMLTPPSDGELASRLDELLLDTIDLNAPAAALSVGQRQRLCLARATMTGPDVLLLDEPTASLDRESETIVEQITETLCAAGTTIVMVTHNAFTPTSVPIVTIRVQKGKVRRCL